MAEARDGIFDSPASELKKRGALIVAAILFLTTLTGFCSLALAPSLAATALLAYTFGLRHGVDADHIAAIDNVTRRLVTNGRQPTTVGLFFALGHSTVVTIMCGIVVIAGDFMKGHMSNFTKVGGIVGALISGTFLVVIGALNMISARDLWTAWREGTKYGGHTHPLVGVVARCCPAVFEGIRHPWQMFPVGLLFGLGFDTSSEIGLLGMVAVSHGDVPRSYIMLLPLLFMAGMCLVDSVNGIFMAWAYGRALGDPMQRLYYNLFLTITSGSIALAVGAVELLGVVRESVDLSGRFWDTVGAINDNFEDVGLAVIGIFVCSMIVAFICFNRVFPGGRAWEDPAKEHLLRYVQAGEFIDRSGI